MLTVILRVFASVISVTNSCDYIYCNVLRTELGKRGGITSINNNHLCPNTKQCARENHNDESTGTRPFVSPIPREKIQPSGGQNRGRLRVHKKNTILSQRNDVFNGVL